MTHVLMGPMLRNLAGDPRGAALAALSVQTKVEKLVLAELVFHAKNVYPQYEFWLEERSRRDLTIRHKQPVERGHLLEWIEAKMCYSDCVARHMTGRAGRSRVPKPHARPDEYRELVAQDVAKQQTCPLPLDDRTANLTVALFVFHRVRAHPRHIYYPEFRNRKGFTSDEIKHEAIRYCEKNISHAIQRPFSERVDVCLDDCTELLCFFYSTTAPKPGLEVIGGVDGKDTMTQEGAA